MKTIDDNSWVKLYRKMVTWRWFTDVNTSHFFLYCLFTANWEDKEWKTLKIPKGSFVSSLKKMAEGSGLTQQEVRTAIKKLESTGEIQKKSTNGFTIISICNYAIYQDTPEQQQQTSNKRATNEQQTSNKRITTTKEYKEGEEINNIYNPPFIPPLLEEVSAYCRERGNGVDADRFVSYYESIGWVVGKTKMKDWKAAVRTWERKESSATPTQEQPANTPKIKYDRNGNPIKQRKWE